MKNYINMPKITTIQLVDIIKKTIKTKATSKKPRRNMKTSLSFHSSQ